MVATTTALPTATAAAGIQHGEFAPETAQHDLGGVPVLTVLALPFAGLELALHIHLGALFQVLLGHVGNTVVEHHNPVPLGPFPALAGGAVVPGLGGRHRHVDDLIAVLGEADLGITAQVSNQNDFVNAAGHAFRPLQVVVEFRSLISPGYVPRFSRGFTPILATGLSSSRH